MVKDIIKQVVSMLEWQAKYYCGNISIRATHFLQGHPELLDTTAKTTSAAAVAFAKTCLQGLSECSANHSNKTDLQQLLSLT